MPYLQYGKLNFEPYPRNGIDANGNWTGRRDERVSSQALAAG